MVTSNKIDTEECQKARKNLIQKIKTLNNKFEDNCQKEKTEKKSDLKKANEDKKKANQDFLYDNKI